MYFLAYLDSFLTFRSGTSWPSIVTYFFSLPLFSSFSSG